MATKPNTVKQRSLNLDDKTYKMLQRFQKNRAFPTTSAALRFMIRDYLDESPPLAQGPRARANEQPKVMVPAAKAPRPKRTAPREATVIPDPKQETFTVPSKFRERGPRRSQVDPHLHSEDLDF